MIRREVPPSSLAISDEATIGGFDGLFQFSLSHICENNEEVSSKQANKVGCLEENITSECPHDLPIDVTTTEGMIKELEVVRLGQLG